MALLYLSVQVTENSVSDTFSSLSRNFDQTIDNINNDNNSSSTTTEATNDNDESSSTTTEATNDNDESLQE